MECEPVSEECEDTIQKIHRVRVKRERTPAQKEAFDKMLQAQNLKKKQLADLDFLDRESVRLEKQNKKTEILNEKIIQKLKSKMPSKQKKIKEYSDSEDDEPEKKYNVNIRPEKEIVTFPKIIFY